MGFFLLFQLLCFESTFFYSVNEVGEASGEIHFASVFWSLAAGRSFFSGLPQYMSLV